MSHIYQPVMLLTLLQHDGQCSETDIAKAISVHDPTQIEYYEAITRNMVGRVLTKHGVVKREGKHFSLLSARPLSKDQRAPASSGRMTRRTAHQWLKWVIGNREIIPAHCVIPSHLYLGYPSRTHTVAPGSTIDYKPIPPVGISLASWGSYGRRSALCTPSINLRTFSRESRLSFVPGTVCHAYWNTREPK